MTVDRDAVYAIGTQRSLTPAPRLRTYLVHAHSALFACPRAVLKVNWTAVVCCCVTCEIHHGKQVSLGRNLNRNAGMGARAWRYVVWLWSQRHTSVLGEMKQTSHNVVLHM